MLRNFTIALLVVSLAVSVVIGFRGEKSAAQSSEGKSAPAPSDGPADNGRLLKPVNPLPISKVVLFNSGVGYFHRTGMVEGDARVDLQFQTGDINDLIKSLVIHDTNGKVMPVRYDSQEPIEKTLRSFAINLSSNPTYGEILNQARGEKVEIVLVANNNGLPGTLQGTIVGMEEGRRLPGITAIGPGPTTVTTTEMELLNLMCVEGLRSVPLNQIQRLRFLNPAIENELRRALEVVAGGHDSQKKSVRLGFQGEGKREVKVGYVTENPIWKTSYRIIIDKAGKTKLIGWANVENTSDEDWHDVKLTLVSGRPISFQMDLYPPLFIPRPTVEPELFASLRPPTYAGPVAGQFGFGGGAFGGGSVVFNGNFGGGAGGLFNGGGAQGQFGFQGAPRGGGAVDPPMDGATMPAQSQMNGNFGGQFGFQGFNSNLAGMNRYQNRIDSNFAGNPRLAFKDLQQRRNDSKSSKEQTAEQARQVGSIIAGVDPDLIESALTAEDLGNPARFVIEEKVSLARQQSAMIPILEQPIEAARVSIYNQSVQAKHPLLGLKMKNNSKQSLMQGPIAVYDDEQYAGDARILDLQPGEERYVSYAIDTGIEVAPFDRVVPGPEMIARMENGRLQVQYKLRSTRAYIVKNRSPEARQIVIEQPVRDGWRFTEARKAVQMAPGQKGPDGVDKAAIWKSGDAEKPSERTRDLYRFAVSVQPGETMKYEVSEELPRLDPFESTKQADWTGFATTLGLDVWTDSKRTPDGAFTLEDVKGTLKVTHKDRRTTTYFVRNRAEVERTIWLDHFVVKDRRLVGDVKPATDDPQRYRFKLILPPGKTLTQSVVEEFVDARWEGFVLTVGEPTNQGPGAAAEIPADRFITELGFEVWRVRKTLPATLASARFIKSELHTTIREHESVAYHIRNLAGEERTYQIDHTVPAQWSLTNAAKAVEGLSNRFRYAVKAGPGQIATQEVTEERTTTRKETLGELSDERVKALATDLNVTRAVKENILKGRALIKDLAQSDAALKDLQTQLGAITDEQTRIKSNIEKLPANSELHKRLIDKFDKQETALEGVQKQIVEKASQRKSLRKDYETFLENLNGE